MPRQKSPAKRAARATRPPPGPVPRAARSERYLDRSRPAPSRAWPARNKPRRRPQVRGCISPNCVAAERAQHSENFFSRETSSRHFPTDRACVLRSLPATMYYYVLDTVCRQPPLNATLLMNETEAELRPRSGKPARRSSEYRMELRFDGPPWHARRSGGRRRYLRPCAIPARPNRSPCRSATGDWRIRALHTTH